MTIVPFEIQNTWRMKLLVSGITPCEPMILFTIWVILVLALLKFKKQFLADSTEQRSSSEETMMEDKQETKEWDGTLCVTECSLTLVELIFGLFMILVGCLRFVAWCMVILISIPIDLTVYAFRVTCTTIYQLVKNW